jgi:hypothetical protein
MACDDLQKDSNLTDSCIFINDGPAAQWWMSPDINLNGFTDVAKTGQNNTVDVTVHRGPDNDKCTALTAASNIVVEVWVSAGGLNLSPLNAKSIGTKIIPKSQLPANGQRSLDQAGQIVNWTTSTNPADPDGPGHRCLIARVYPEGDGPPEFDCFHVRGDTHVAQRNISIVTVSKFRSEGRMSAQILTVNPDRELPQRATVRVVTDPRPDRRVMEILRPGLLNTGVFRQVTSARPRRMNLDFPDFPDARRRDYTRPGCLPSLFWARSFVPRLEADVQLQPGQVTTFNFEADLSNGEIGDAFVFYVTHLRPDNQEIGGLTVVGVIS